MSYAPETGVMHWRIKPNGRVSFGAEVGWKTPIGHLRVKYAGKTYAVHRLAWFYVYGEWPAQFIDHKNGCPSDNRIDNLRCVSHEINAQNLRKPTCRNTSGYLGVSAKRKKFIASVHSLGKTRHSQSFKTPEEAYEAYLSMKRALHEGCTL